MAVFDITIDGARYTVELNGVQGADGRYVVTVDGVPRAVRLTPPAEPAGLYLAVVAGRPYELALDSELRWMQTAHGRHDVELRDVAAAAPRPHGGDGRVKAPIPGTVVRLLAEPGQAVAAGQPILILEAMKMQNEICAGRAGVLASVHVAPGQSVGLGVLLAEIGEGQGS